MPHRSSFPPLTRHEEGFERWKWELTVYPPPLVPFHSSNLEEETRRLTMCFLLSLTLKLRERRKHVTIKPPAYVPLFSCQIPFFSAAHMLRRFITVTSPGIVSKRNRNVTIEEREKVKENRSMVTFPGFSFGHVAPEHYSSLSCHTRFTKDPVAWHEEWAPGWNTSYHWTNKRMERESRIVSSDKRL